MAQRMTLSAATIARLEREGKLDADAAKALREPKRNRYGMVGPRGEFDSKPEARRAAELRLLEREGTIRNLELRKPHLSYLLIVNGYTVGRYTADARYVVCASGETIVEDVKSKATKTEAYGLRKRLMLACHGIAIREVLYERPKRNRAR